MPIATWIEAGRFHVDWALRVDTLSAVMLAMVSFVSMLIHVYSIGYMAHDAYPRYRFFAYLSLFTFSMLMLVTADNLTQLFFGWEGVGLCSYLLIGYWYDRPSACAAAIKAFIVNRIADLPFAVGIALIFFKFGSVEFSTIFPAVAQHQGDTYALFGTTFPAIEVIGFLLFIGAMGKSAQLGLHVWLPDAMEGPTPVSALIHAATMVTAGVFLMARMSPLMEYAPVALGFVTFIGASTALFAATIGCAQNDIKRVIAYSTCSQLGYMFVAAGVGAYQVSVFHLITHAFFKALLFLGAGSVIHAMSDEQDMRKMGGIWKMIPMTYGVMWVGNLALAGIPPFAGWYSKDAIISAAYAAHSGIGMYGFICTVLAAFLTAFYSWRLLFMTFHGTPRADHHVMEHVHESPWVMLGRYWFCRSAPWLPDSRCTPGSSARIGRRSGTAASITARATTCWRASSTFPAGPIFHRRSSACSGSPPPTLCTLPIRCCRCGSPPCSGRSTCCSSTSGISTRSTMR